ncbi:hypothetical protein MBLNU459_g5884t1 [Dothideomycetes sp. NU459]
MPMIMKRGRVLCPEKISADGLALLRSSLEVDERKDLSAEELLQIIGDYEALIVRSETKVTAALLAAGKELKVVARAGVGVDNVDVAAATKLGIIVVNSPVGNINAAAEHTIALLMATARNITDACASLKAGKWERSRLVGIEVKGKTLAIIVGLTVARMANGLGMNLVAYDPYANPSMAASASVTMVDDLPALLKEADFLTIHTPLIASTKGMIGTAELASMKKTARILNVARGGMVDEEALLSALENGTIAGAGVDVFSTEPPAPDSPATRLIAHPKVVATPHLGASTVEAQENVSIDVCTQVLSILSGALPRSAVNAPIILPEEYRTLQPFVQLVENMGSLYTQHFARLSKSRKTRTTFDLIYEGSLAELNTTKPLFAALVKGMLGPITASDTLNINIVNAELVAKERGISINEARSREAAEPSPGGYSSLVTLRARVDPRSPSASRSQRGSTDARTATLEQDHVISGFVSNNMPYISRLGRFSTSFVPSGTLLICRNYDSPGKIGVVGGRLGKAGINIKFMTVAPLDSDGEEGGEGDKEREEVLVKVDSLVQAPQNEQKENEALMILGVDGVVGEDVRKSLLGEDGVLEASVVVL